MLNHYLEVRQKTEKIVSVLEPEDFVAQPIIDVSPPKWHLGHTSWFFENFILVPFLKGYQIFSNDFAFIFNSYYESQGDRILRNKRGTLTRPATSLIFDYRKYIDASMTSLLKDSNSLTEEVMKFLEIGINHEQQHQELLITDIKYILGSNPLMPFYQTLGVNSDNPIQLSWLKVKSGNYTIGYNGNDFHFDNERGAHTVYIHEFESMNRLVTNEEFVAFINDSGYSRAELWLMEGWEWVKSVKAKAPFYWFQKNEEWYIYQINGVQKVNPIEPVTHVNFYEAEAFARWKKMRLLTEPEWEVLAQQYGKLSHLSHFQEKEHFHPASAKDNQLFGTAWEWTNSAYLPHPFYEQEEGALGEYNGKFMVNQMVLKGGSCATPKTHFRPSYRNFFHPHLQWQFTGIRLAKKTISYDKH